MALNISELMFVIYAKSAKKCNGLGMFDFRLFLLTSSSLSLLKNSLTITRNCLKKDLNVFITQKKNYIEKFKTLKYQFSYIYKFKKKLACNI